MGLDHVLGIQPLPQLLRVSDSDHLSETVFKAPIQGLITRDRSRRRVILAAKSKEEPDHILRVAVLPLVHVDLDCKLNRFLRINNMNHVAKNQGLLRELLVPPPSPETSPRS